MMMNDWFKVPTLVERGRKRILQKLAYLIDNNMDRLFKFLLYY
jgi:hypothetical protein